MSVIKLQEMSDAVTSAQDDVYTKSSLIEALEQHRSYDQVEETSRLVTLFFLNEGHNCFSRENLAGHITASSWIINHEKTHALLVHHKKLGRWMQAGGHCDGDEDVLAGALREVEEETGLSNVAYHKSLFDVDAHAIPKIGEEPAHIHYDIRFLFKASLDDKIIMSDESHDVKWFSLDEISQFDIQDNLLRMVNKTKEME